MKNILLFFGLFLFFSNPNFAQNLIIEKEIVKPFSPTENMKHHCGTPSPTEEEHRYILENIIEKEQQRAMLRNDVATCLPMKIHIVRETGGTGGLSLGNLAIAIANLNLVYYDAGIEFFVCGGINYINDTDLYDFNATTGDADGVADNENDVAVGEVTNAINVFFMNSIVTSTGFIAAGYARFPANASYSNRIFMINSVANYVPNSTFSHELGHYFSLYHTHEGTEDGNDPVLHNAERITRNPPNANCSTKGDLLCDTDADPRYSAADFDLATCTYTGMDVDDLGGTYFPDTAINNIMSYYPDQCGGVFTAGQFTRIASGLAERLTHSTYNFGCTAAAVIPATGMTATVNGNQIDLTWTDNALNELGYIIEKSSTSNIAGFLPIIYGGVGENVTVFSDTEGIASNTTYWYRVRPVNSACDNYSNVASVTTGLIYCNLTYTGTTGCSGSYIDDFSMDGDGGTNEINNTSSGCTNNGYSNFTNLSADVTSSTSYSFTVCKNLTFTRNVEIWVDWNIDGDFEDANEQILNGIFAVAPSCYTGTITVPATAVTGSTTMRVVIANSTSINDPCGSYSFGESEDYSLNVSGVLPITLTSFEGKNRGEGVLLSWETASELDNDYFTLERSEDGTQFEAFAKINGAGSTEIINRYDYIDFTPFNGKNYYRLKQTDFDETYSYSNIIVVEVKTKGDNFATIIPNPVQKDEFTLLYNAVNQGNLEIQILNVNGKKVGYQKWQVEEGKNSFAIDISKIKAGVYFLQTIQNSSIQTVRFVRL